VPQTRKSVLLSSFGDDFCSPEIKPYEGTASQPNLYASAGRLQTQRAQTQKSGPGSNAREGVFYSSETGKGGRTAPWPMFVFRWENYRNR
jgi:hypothetical protein